MATSGDYLRLHFIVFLWGFSAILGKLITLSAVELIWYRSFFAAVGMALVIMLSRGTFKVSGADTLRLVGIGTIVAMHWFSFFGSARLSNVSVSLVGFATNSLWAALLEPWFNRTQIKKYELFLGLVVLAGLYIIFSFDFEYRLGLLVAVFAGFTTSLFSVLNARMVKRIPSRTISFYQMVSIFVVTGLCLPFVATTGTEIHFPVLPTFMDFIYILLLAGACSVYAFTVAIELMKRVSVFMIQLTLNLEPLYGIIMAVLIFGDQEKMSTNFYVGALMIMIAVIAYPFMRKRFDRPVLIN